MSDQRVAEGCSPAPEEYKIIVADNGPYLVYGRVPMSLQYIMPNKKGESWYFQAGKQFSTEAEPTALCRCGASRRKPYCDGSHIHADWDPELTARQEGIYDEAKRIDGDDLTMTDNRKYCVFARFCHPGGDAWTLVEQSDDPQARQMAIREASLCPSARLTAWDKRSGAPIEPRFEPSLGLIEDLSEGQSGGLWVRGGITVMRQGGAGGEGSAAGAGGEGSAAGAGGEGGAGVGGAGSAYEVRNRVVLCRCGQSANKPYCDGTHTAIKWRDGIDGEPNGATTPDDVTYK